MIIGPLPHEIFSELLTFDFLEDETDIRSHI